MIRNNKEAVKELIELCQTLALEENLQVTIKEAAKAGAIVGGGTFAGALLFGPLGILVGIPLAAGAFLAAQDKFKPVHEVLAEMPEHKKAALKTSLDNLAQKLRLKDAFKLFTLITVSTEIRSTVVSEIGNFVLKELNMKMVQ